MFEVIILVDICSVSQIDFVLVFYIYMYIFNDVFHKYIAFKCNYSKVYLFNLNGLYIFEMNKESNPKYLKKL